MLRLRRLLPCCIICNCLIIPGDQRPALRYIEVRVLGKVITQDIKREQDITPSRRHVYTAGASLEALQRSRWRVAPLFCSSLCWACYWRSQVCQLKALLAA